MRTRGESGKNSPRGRNHRGDSELFCMILLGSHCDPPAPTLCQGDSLVQKAFHLKVFALLRCKRRLLASVRSVTAMTCRCKLRQPRRRTSQRIRWACCGFPEACPRVLARVLARFWRRYLSRFRPSQAFILQRAEERRDALPMMRSSGSTESEVRRDPPRRPARCSKWRRMHPAKSDLRLPKPLFFAWCPPSWIGGCNLAKTGFPRLRHPSLHGVLERPMASFMIHS